MDPAFAAALPQLQHGSGNQVTPAADVNETAQRKRARWMAVLLGLVAVAVYLGFMWATANGF